MLTSIVPRDGRLETATKGTIHSTPALYVSEYVFLALSTNRNSQKTCPGQQFALVSASYAIVRICQAFSGLEDFNRAGEPPRMTFGIVQLHMDGVKIRFVE
jgi:hypothetical protein